MYEMLQSDGKMSDEDALRLDEMYEGGRECEVCGDSGAEEEMVFFDGVWFHEDCAKECDIYECEECGNYVEWDHLKVCPICKAEK